MSMLISSPAFTRPPPSSVLTDCRSSQGDDWLSTTFLVQNSSQLYLLRLQYDRWCVRQTSMREVVSWIFAEVAAVRFKHRVDNLATRSQWRANHKTNHILKILITWNIDSIKSLKFRIKIIFFHFKANHFLLNQKSHSKSISNRMLFLKIKTMSSESKFTVSVF